MRALPALAAPRWLPRLLWALVAAVGEGRPQPELPQDAGCGTAVETLTGPCSFEFVRTHAGNGSLDGLPAACAELVQRAAIVPSAYSGTCLPGALFAVLRRALEVLKLSHDRGCHASVALALEVEHYYSQAMRLWPRKMPPRWVARWDLERWQDEVYIYFERGAAHESLMTHCFESLRQRFRAGALPWALENLPNQSWEMPHSTLVRNLLLADLPAWIAHLGPGGAGDRCHTAVPTRLACGMSFHSMQGQDLWVLSNIAARLPRGRGFFLEVGGHHPETLSNTLMLEKAAGWDGVCIEPFPRGDWSQRRAVLLQAAVGPESNWLPFFRPGHMWGGLLMSLNRSERDDMWKYLKDPQLTVVDVKTQSLATLLGSARPGGKEVPSVIHFVSIDTEGSELEILRGFPFEKYLPLSFTIEHHFKEPKRTQTQEFLQRRGYLLDRTIEHDDFFLLRGFERFLEQEA